MGVVEHPDKTVVFLFREQKDTQKTTTMAAELDMMNRDPNNINPHLKVGFEDIFGEPEEIRSMDCVWKNSYKCFECWKQLCYTIMTFCCGICIAMEWAVSSPTSPSHTSGLSAHASSASRSTVDVARNCTASACIAAWIHGWKHFPSVAAHSRRVNKELAASRFLLRLMCRCMLA